MAQLLPLIGKAAATTATTAVPASMAGTYFAGASGATAGLANALNAGITAGSALGGGGSLAALTPGIFAKAAPALGGLQSLTPTLATKAGPGLFNTMGMNPLAGMQSVLPSASPTLASGAYNPAYAEMLGKQFAANSFSAGSPDVARTLLASTDKVAPMAFKPPPSAQFLNTFQEGAALPGVTSGATAPTAAFPSGYSLPPQTFGNVAGGPAIPKVTSSLPVSTTQTGLMPPSIPPTVDPSKGFLSNALSLAKNPSMQGAADYIETHPYASAGAAYGLYNLLKPKPKGPEKDVSLIRPYEFERSELPDTREPGGSSERQYFAETFTPLEPYEAPGPEYKKAAEGGLMGLAVGGPVETMSAMNAIGGNMMYPQSQLQTPMYSNPMMQRPEATNVISPSGDAGVGAYSGEPKFAKGGVSALGLASYAGDRDAVRTNQNTHSQNINSGSSEKLKATKRAAKSGDFAAYKALQNAGYDMHAPVNYAGGGLSDLGGYSDGGRLLKGPGDGVSDSIPAVIGERQPARLADGEFVVPARIVSELGNGSTEAGARKLYAMMDRVQKARRKTVGKNRVATNTRAEKHLPA